jgi:hypothetical protein
LIKEVIRGQAQRGRGGLKNLLVSLKIDMRLKSWQMLEAIEERKVQ